MNGLKMLVAIALMVGGMTVVAAGENRANQPAPNRHDDKRTVDRWSRGDEKKIEERKPRSAPEIDVRSTVSALALLSSLLLLFRGERRV